MHYKIVSRWDSNKIVYEGEAESLKDLVQTAIRSGSNLSGSDLRDSDLRDSNLSGSNLRGSNLSGSNLRDSDLRGSDLSGSNLRGSDLRGSDLRGSNLRGSDLRDSDLRGSNLSGSNLRDSDLRDSDLRGSDLSGIKADFFMTLLHAIPKERTYLRTALIEGRVNGSQYEGECACLKGTLEKCGRTASAMGLRHNVDEPAEAFFLGINEGDTQETNQISKIVVEWMDEFEMLAKNLS
jgi:uncharacterized protein YjbI with pentapeptide repeats